LKIANEFAFFHSEGITEYFQEKLNMDVKVLISGVDALERNNGEILSGPDAVVLRKYLAAILTSSGVKKVSRGEGYDDMLLLLIVSLM